MMPQSSLAEVVEGCFGCGRRDGPVKFLLKDPDVTEVSRAK
jgi:hypothetical protein